MKSEDKTLVVRRPAPCPTEGCERYLTLPESIERGLCLKCRRETNTRIVRPLDPRRTRG